MAEKEKKSPRVKQPKSPYSDPTGGIIFSREEWKNVFVPNLRKLIDQNVQELKLKLKFDKEPPKKQGMFNRLSNWWSNIFWGKHNKYHNPYYHRNILGALGAPSRKNEMTLGIYKIFKEASEKYDLLVERRLVIDDVIDDWLADLNIKLSTYLQSVEDNHYFNSAIIKAAFDAKGVKPTADDAKGGRAGSIDPLADVSAARAASAASSAADAGKNSGEVDTKNASVANVEGGPAGDMRSGEEPASAVPDTGDDELEKAEPVPTSAVSNPKKPGGGKRKRRIGDDAPGDAADPKSSTVVPPAGSPTEGPLGAPTEQPEADSTVTPTEQPAEDSTEQPPNTGPSTEEIFDPVLWLKSMGPEQRKANLAVIGYEEEKRSGENPQGIALHTFLKPGEILSAENLDKVLTPKEINRLAKMGEKMTGIKIKDSTIYYHDDIDLLYEIEADYDEYDDYDVDDTIAPVNFDGMTLYERTLTCLDKLRKK